MRIGVMVVFLLLPGIGFKAAEAPGVRLQVTAPWNDYEVFMKLSAGERRARFNVISAENRATIVQTHVKRWLDKNRGRLTASEAAVFEEIITFLSADLSRKPAGTANERQDAIKARMRCRVSPEDVREATNVFGDAADSSGQKVRRSYLTQARCWLDWVIDGVVDYLPNIGQ